MTTNRFGSWSQSRPDRAAAPALRRQSPGLRACQSRRRVPRACVEAAGRHGDIPRLPNRVVGGGGGGSAEVAGLAPVAARVGATVPPAIAMERACTPPPPTPPDRGSQSNRWPGEKEGSGTAAATPACNRRDGLTSGIGRRWRAQPTAKRRGRRRPRFRSLAAELRRSRGRPARIALVKRLGRRHPGQGQGTERFAGNAAASVRDIGRSRAR